MQKFRKSRIGSFSTFVGLCREEGVSVVRASSDYPHTILQVVNRTDKIVYEHRSYADAHRSPTFPEVKAILEIEGIVVVDGQWDLQFVNHIAGLRSVEGIK